MREDLVTPFWRNAYRSLPAHVRSRYHAEFVAAERLELVLGGLVEAWTRVKSALAGRPALAE